MNRYVITKMQIKGQEYCISALYNEKRKMIEVLSEPLTEHVPIQVGNIYIGRVERILPNINAAFVKIAPDQTCYLPLDEIKNPIFTKKISTKKALVEGEELLVQIVREALKTKEPTVSTNLSFTGQYVVLTSGNLKLSVSGKLDKTQKTHYKTMLHNFMTANKEPGCGIIVRTNAKEVEDIVVLRELHELYTIYQTMVLQAVHRTCYTILYQEEPFYLRHIKDLQISTLEEIVTDERDIFEAICEKYGIKKEFLVSQGSVVVPVNEVKTPDGIKIRHYTDEAYALANLYSLHSELEEATRERVWLKSGAYLVIQPTEAMTVIDVNTGKNVSKKSQQEHFLQVNIEAAFEIARQLRLRNISGIIIVDFINLDEKEAQNNLLSKFREYLKQDPISTQLVDITGLGLVEVTRKKVYKPLAEQFCRK